jgi:hypothetical protein
VKRTALGLAALVLLPGVTLSGITLSGMIVPAGASPAAAGAIARAAAPGSIGVQLLDIPAAEQKDPRAHLYIIDRLTPGTVIHRRIEVSNTTASTAPVKLYAAAATIGHGVFLGSVGHTPDALSTWTSVQPGASEIPSGGHLIATVTVAVPRDATSGERYAVVWAEVRSPPIPGSAVTEVNRVGIRLYLSIGYGAAPASNFTIESLTAKRAPDGDPLVVAAVHNTGGRALDMYGSLKLLSGPGGLRAGPYAAVPGTTVAIGGTEPVTVVLSKLLPDGPWDARITLLSGLLSRTAHATITFPRAGSSPAVLATTSSGRSAWLYLLVAGGILLLGLALLLGLLAGRRRRRS